MPSGDLAAADVILTGKSTMHDQQWETKLADLLNELTAVQDELLDVLTEKRKLMVNNDAPGMARMVPREQQLSERLQDCHLRRGELLKAAAQHGLPGESLNQLATAVDRQSGKSLGKQVREASARMRLLQHHSLTNWVLAQRTLLHLSQMLEIIATGGQLKPTYGKGSLLASSGALVDQEV